MNLIFVAFVMFSFVACTNPLGTGATHVDSNYGETERPPAPAGYEQISGAAGPVASTVGRYKVEATAGVSTGSIQLQSTKNKTVYLSVQGQMDSK